MQIKGNDKIVFIKRSGVYTPVGCLTVNGISEESEVFDTTTRNSQGWKTSLPDLQGFTITLEGVQIRNANLIDIDTLKALKRAQQRISWGIGSASDEIEEEGKGYIIQIEDNAEVNQNATFSATIQGWGEINVVQFGLGADLNDFLEDGEGNVIQP